LSANAAFNRREHPKSDPVYQRDVRDTIHLRVANWEDNRHELFGGKGLDDMASSLIRTRFTEGDPRA